MPRVAIWAGWGGFTLNVEGQIRYKELSGSDYLQYGENRTKRTDPHLIQVIEEMGHSAGDDLKVLDVPDGVEWHIEEYDGWESIHEDHRVWE